MRDEHKILRDYLCIIEDRAIINPTKIYLFGSRARGDFQPESDYDITLVYDGDLSKREVKIESRRSCRGIRAAMDILVISSEELNDFAHVANTISREVLENGKLVYG